MSDCEVGLLSEVAGRAGIIADKRPEWLRRLNDYGINRQLFIDLLMGGPRGYGTRPPLGFFPKSPPPSGRTPPPPTGRTPPPPTIRKPPFPRRDPPPPTRKTAKGKSNAVPFSRSKPLSRVNSAAIGIGKSANTRTATVVTPTRPTTKPTRRIDIPGNPEIVPFKRPVPKTPTPTKTPTPVRTNPTPTPTTPPQPRTLPPGFVPFVRPKSPPTIAPTPTPTTPTITPTPTPSTPPLPKTLPPGVVPFVRPQSPPQITPNPTPSTPTVTPSPTPTTNPTQNPTTNPTITPAPTPSSPPQITPSQIPSTPTTNPTQNPTTNPTVTPSQTPSSPPITIITTTPNPSTTPSTTTTTTTTNQTTTTTKIVTTTTTTPSTTRSPEPTTRTEKCVCPKEEEIRYEKVDLPYGICDKDGKGKLKSESFNVRVGSVTQAQIDLFSASAQLAMKSCECGGAAIAIFPDWWQTKINADRPQLAILYREWNGTKFGEYYHTQHIPHYNKPKGHKPSFPDIKKGSAMGILILNDNSKIIVNADNNSEAKKVINAYKTFVKGEFLKGVKGPRMSERAGDIKKVTTRAIRAEFYSKGQEDTAPDWSITLI